MSTECFPVQHWWRGFDSAEIERRLRALPHCPSSGPSSDAAAARDPSWNHYYSEAVVAQEKPGPPEAGGAFEQARGFIDSYQFSDPSIVQAYFDPRAEVDGRPMLLEIKVLGLHTLCGVMVRATRDDKLADRSVYGYRYDTLEGHLEAGAEWFLLTKDHASGAVRFRIQAVWRRGEIPNWWTRVGFHVLARPFQRTWHRHAYMRLRAFVKAEGLPPIPLLIPILKTFSPTERLSDVPVASVLPKYDRPTSSDDGTFVERERESQAS